MSRYCLDPTVVFRNKEHVDFSVPLRVFVEMKQTVLLVKDAINPISPLAARYRHLCEEGRRISQERQQQRLDNNRYILFF